MFHYRNRSPPWAMIFFVDKPYQPKTIFSVLANFKEVSMNAITKKLSESNLFAICPDATSCKRACGNKRLIKVFSKKAKMLCMHTLDEKTPVFYTKKEQPMKTNTVKSVKNIYPRRSINLKKIFEAFSLFNDNYNCGSRCLIEKCYRKLT